MMPNLLYQKLANDSELFKLGINSTRVIESQSVDERPFNDGYFITVAFEELLLASPSKLSRGERTVTVAVHRNWEIDRDFSSIDKILNRIDILLLNVENESGTDGVRVTSIRRSGRSGNMADEGWKTITRTSTYGVLYDEYAA
jgi:hypothetical protein